MLKTLTVAEAGIHGDWQPPGQIQSALYPAKRRADEHYLAWRQLCRREFRRWMGTPMLTDIRYWEMTGCGWNPLDEELREWFFGLPETGRRGLYEDSGGLSRGVRRARRRLWRAWKLGVE